MSLANDDLRRSIGRRLKQLRVALGHTQEEMAHALGIRAPRYSKYEIGRSEAPYEVLMKLARLANVSLDYLVAGKEAQAARRFSSRNHLSSLVGNLPIAAVVYDSQDRLVEFNRLYQETYFSKHRRFLRAGVSHEQVLRTWAYSQGLSVDESEAFIAKRLSLKLSPKTPAAVQAGPHGFELRATWYDNLQLVLVTDLADTLLADTLPEEPPG